MINCIKYFLSFVFCLCSFLCFSQNAKIDLLKNNLLLAEKMKAGYTADTSKIKALNALADELAAEQTDSAIALSMQALKISEKIKWDKGVAESLVQIAHFYKNRSNYSSATEYYLKGLTAIDVLEKKSISEMLNKILKGKAIVLFNLGAISNEQGDNKKALSYYYKTLTIAEQIKNKRLIAALYGNIGNCYTDMLNMDTALIFYNKALELNKEMNLESGINSNWGNIGSAYYNKGDYPKALEYFLKTLKYIEKENDPASRSILYVNIGAIYSKVGSYKESEKLLLKSVALAEEANFFRSLSIAHQGLSELYDTIGKPKLALLHYKKFIAARDSIINEEKIKLQTEAELKYEFEKTELETKAEQDKKDALANQEKLLSEKKQFWIEVACAAIIVALVTVAFVLYRRYKTKKKTSEELATKNDLIEAKQKQILDSIRYAKRIQQSLLPTEKYIEKNLKRLQKR